MSKLNIQFLEGNGSFDSSECKKYLQEADVVVTNPPFSRFREFFQLLIEEGKGFLVLGPLTAVGYKKIAPALTSGQVRLGRSFRNRPTTFIQPDGSLRTIHGIEWYTNLHDWWPEPLVLTEEYSPERYPKYDNAEAIEVSKTRDIPKDYYGVMGVPISFIDKWTPEQFEVLCLLENRPILHGKHLYSRLLIKRVPNTPKNSQ